MQFNANAFPKLSSESVVKQIQLFLFFQKITHSSLKYIIQPKHIHFRLKIFFFSYFVHFHYISYVLSYAVKF